MITPPRDKSHKSHLNTLILLYSIYLADLKYSLGEEDFFFTTGEMPTRDVYRVVKYQLESEWVIDRTAVGVIKLRRGKYIQYGSRSYSARQMMESDPKKGFTIHRTIFEMTPLGQAYLARYIEDLRNAYPETFHLTGGFPEDLKQKLLTADQSKVKFDPLDKRL